MLNIMRTTLNLDDDILATAKALAAQQGRSLGEVVSVLVRRAVEPAVEAPVERNGIPLFPVARAAGLVTPEIVDELLDETP
jgi:hypothetical protein